MYDSACLNLMPEKRYVERIGLRIETHILYMNFVDQDR